MDGSLSMVAASPALENAKNLINAVCQPHWFLILSVTAFVIFLAGYRVFTKPSVAVPLAGLIVAFFLASCLDPNFLLIVKKPDNVPIVMMMFAITFFIWLAFRQAALNDGRIERGEPLLEAGAEDKVLVWPDLVYIELICLVLFTAFLTVWAIVLRAPLSNRRIPRWRPIRPRPRGISWACRKCWSTSTPGWRGCCCPA